MHHVTGIKTERHPLLYTQAAYLYPDVVEDRKMLSVNLHRQQTMSLHASAMCEGCNVLLTLQN